LIAAQRAAGEAFCGTLNAQLGRSAVRPDLLAKAALVTVMQTTNSAAAAISITSLMAALLAVGCPPPSYHQKIPQIPRNSVRSLPIIIPAQRTTIAWAVSIPVQGAYHSG
jgi:hypothetical protein